MTDPFAPRAKAPSDLQMLAQVEQWMAAIRELGREERADLEAPGARLEHLHTPISE